MFLQRLRLPFSRILRICSTNCTPLYTTTQSISISYERHSKLRFICTPFSYTKRLESKIPSEDAPAVFEVENDDEFTEKVIGSPVPVLVEFYADWCPPCRLLGPRLEAIVKGYEKAVLLAKVDVDLAADLAMEYEVSSIPTIIAFKDGQLIERTVGDREDSDLDKLILNLIQ